MHTIAFLAQKKHLLVRFGNLGLSLLPLDGSVTRFAK
jgi:hypothetical protein